MNIQLCIIIKQYKIMLLKNKKTAIIGAGPAGLIMANYYNKTAQM
jgi:ribulose 1,5-bisphosphate synthetase/thiazole synthase